jgi:hypothetical protein
VLVTALDARIGYDEEGKFGRRAFAKSVTLKQAAEMPFRVRPEDSDQDRDRDFDLCSVRAVMRRPGVSLPGGRG